MSKQIWLIRHGESIANAGAATSDHIIIPLSEKGQEQAKQVSLLLPHAPDLIIVSPFLRAQQTAEPTLNRFPWVRTETWEVHEFTYLSPASCVNTTAADRRARVNEYWDRLDPDYIDGEGAESFHQFITRAQTAIDRLNRLSNGLIVMFTHAQFIRAMRLLRDTAERDTKVIMSQFRALPGVWNCEITKIYKDGFKIEKILPRYLQHDIDQLIKNENPNLWDCYWCELYASINSAEVDLEITEEQAAYLRKKYLYGDELEKHNAMINQIINPKS